MNDDNTFCKQYIIETYIDKDISVNNAQMKKLLSHILMTILNIGYCITVCMREGR